MSRFAVALLFITAACSADGSDDDPASSASATEAGDDSSSGGGDDGSSTGGAATGTVTLSFGVSNGVRMGPNLVDPLMGSVYGDVFLTSDVTITGPVDGAMSFASVALDGIDLSTADTATVTWTSDPIPAGAYTFLGMYDLDANFEATDHGPDAGDPATLPNQKFEVVAGQDTAFTVMFEIVYG